MLKPLRSKGQRAPVSQPKFIQAPTQGWYVGTNISDAPEGTAFALDNAFPQLDYVRIRRGTQTYADTGTSAPISSLLQWTDGDVSYLFAACNRALYDVSNTGAASATTVTETGSDLWEAIQFSPTGSATFLLAVNGVDPLLSFNPERTGSYTTTDSTTGVTTTTTQTPWQSNSPAITGMVAPPSFIWAFKSRVFLAEAGTLNAWYLGLGAIGGTATVFQLGGIFKLGGYLLAGATWAIDSSAGVFESCVFVSSEGEVAMYDGAGPEDTAWALKGLYKISRPLGKRCLMKAGGDLAIMTEDGIVPMSKVMTLDQQALQNQAITKAIAPAWRDAVAARNGLDGWSITIWPLESLGMVNLPKVSQDDCTQFVANVRSGAWCRYLGWDANCFAVFSDMLVYGTSDGRVMQGEVGGSDDGANYSATIFPSFLTLGAPVNQKVVKMVRPFFRSNIAISAKITVKVDFDTVIPRPPDPSSGSLPGAKWGIARWGIDIFPYLPAAQQPWGFFPGFGTIVTPCIQITLNRSQTPDVRFTGVEMLFEEGNPLG